MTDDHHRTLVNERSPLGPQHPAWNTFPPFLQRASGAVLGSLARFSHGRPPEFPQDLTLPRSAIKHPAKSGSTRRPPCDLVLPGHLNNISAWPITFDGGRGVRPTFSRW